MALSRKEIDDAASALAEAERSGVQTELLSARHLGMTMDDAYAIQAAFVEKLLAAGKRKIGTKIGLTSKAMQSALGIDIPDSGILLDDMQFDNGAEVPKDRFIQPRIEAEIAFIMKSGLKGPATREDVFRATESIAPSLEILDTRIIRVDPQTGATRKIYDTIADNAANAGLVLGEERHHPDEVDMRWVGAIVSRNGEVEETGLGAGVLNDPATSVVWLVNRLAEYDMGVEAGEIVLSGSFIRPVEATAGSSFYADFGSFGSVSLSFA